MSWAELFSHILQRFNQYNVKFIFGIIAKTKNHQLRMEDELLSIMISANRKSIEVKYFLKILTLLAALKIYKNITSHSICVRVIERPEIC